MGLYVTECLLSTACLPQMSKESIDEIISKLTIQSTHKDLDHIS